MSAIIPLPKTDVNIRLATNSDIPFMDALQKKHSKQVGFLHMKTLEGKIAAGDVLIAEIAGKSAGYLIGCDRYFKRDDLGIIYQINISQEYQRGFVASALLKAQFDRSAYGCRLYCCWCAQDLEANKFWEAMGFVPLAFRAGSTLRRGSGQGARVHIFWQKKIRGNDDKCNWWYPHKTDQGSMRADRLAFPIPPGTHWRDVKAVVLPDACEAKSLPSPHTHHATRTRKPKPVIKRAPLSGGLSFAPAVVAIVETSIEKPKREPRKKIKVDPKYVSATRELRDRYLEQVNENGYSLESSGKYDCIRAITSTNESSAPLLLAA